MLALVGGDADTPEEETDALPVTVQVIALLPLTYMSFCTYSALFKLRLFGTFSLHGGRQSAPGALLFNSM